MTRGSLNVIINVDKKKRWNDTTLRDSTRYPFVWRFKCPYFWCTAFYYAKILKIVYEKHRLYQSDRVYQVKYHDHSSQMLLIGLLLSYEQRPSSNDLYKSAQPTTNLHPLSREAPSRQKSVVAGGPRSDK